MILMRRILSIFVGLVSIFFAISRETGEEYGEDYDKEVFPLARLN